MRSAAALSVTVVLIAAAGCGSSDEKTPAACLDGADAYRRALRGASESVRLRGETPIGSCLTKNQSAGDLTRIGTAMLSVATKLNAEARGSGGSAAAERLGYLIGAARRGAKDTAGIHANLVSRLEAAAEFSPGGAPVPARIRSAYQKGIAAGRDSG